MLKTQNDHKQQLVFNSSKEIKYTNITINILHLKKQQKKENIFLINKS